MSTPRQKYPVGIQTFSEIREKGYIYVDKTDIIYDLINDSKYLFLSRPRRFGKSLLVSTLRCYFEGKKELFQGLAIEQLEQDWNEYPVLHFSMNRGRRMSPDDLTDYLLEMLSKYERQYGISDDRKKTNVRFYNLVEHIHVTTGKEVVVLIDEYDAPLLDVMHEDEELPKLRDIMRNFYAPIKDLDPYLRFVFITGITKFSQVSIFSELNNITDISMEAEYAALCGITEEELLTQLRPGIEELAQKQNITYDETVELLKSAYDGYHFTHPSPDIYNPFSLLSALKRSAVKYYWFGTGTPTYLIEMLRKYKVLPHKIGGIWEQEEKFDAPTERMTSILPLLYQSGYITIKDFNPNRKRYLLDIPNSEVRIGLVHSLLPLYVSSDIETNANNMASDLADCLDAGNIDGALTLLQTFLKTVPYTDNTDYEGHYQALLYVVLSLVGSYWVDVEVRTATGRVDMVARTAHTLYLFEIKIDATAQEALEQIDRKQYSDRFQLCQLPVVKVGMNFSTDTRSITDWVINR